MFAVALARRIGASRAPRLIRTFAAAPPPELSEGERTIYQKLTEKFSPAELQVQDVSGRLSESTLGSGGLYGELSGGCGTFYQIISASEAFKGVPTVKQHRMVNEVLKQEIEGIHGLQVRSLCELPRLLTNEPPS